MDLGRADVRGGFPWQSQLELRLLARGWQDSRPTRSSPRFVESPLRRSPQPCRQRPRRHNAYNFDGFNGSWGRV